MGFAEGLNYIFLHSDEDATVRIESEIHPFYSIPVKNIERLPSLYSEPSIVPRFHYNIRWNRRNYLSREIITPEPRKFPEWEYGTGGRVHTKVFVERHTRNQMISTRYLSLRDIVNPYFNEEDVLKEIDKLYYNSRDKNTLSRLVKILYAGKPSEEREIIRNLFAYEKEFAEFLRDRIFQIEILPLIHGVFLQDVLTKMDERIIKHGLASVSPPVQEVIRRSVSKNKFRSILASPPLKPEEGDDLRSKIESIVFTRFSRKIYYEKGQYLAYRLSSDPASAKEEIPLIDSRKFQWARSSAVVEFLGAGSRDLYILLKDWVEAIRFDTLVHSREIDSHEFFRLPPGIILRIPFYPTGRCTICGGILRGRKSFELYLSNWEFFTL